MCQRHVVLRRGWSKGGGRPTDGLKASHAAADAAAAADRRRFRRPSRLPRHYVDDGVLDERGEDEDEADDHPDVDGLDVGNARQGGPGAGAHRRRREDRQQSDGDPRRRRVDVDPERHPGEDDDEDARNVDLDEEEADVSTKDETNFKAWKRACETGDRNTVEIKFGFRNRPVITEYFESLTACWQDINV